MFFFTWKGLNYFEKCRKCLPLKCGRYSQVSLTVKRLSAVRQWSAQTKQPGDCPVIRPYKIRTKVIPLHCATSRVTPPLFLIFSKTPLGFHDVNVTAAPFACSAIKVCLEHDRSLKPQPPHSSQRCSSASSLHWRTVNVTALYFKTIVVGLLTVVYFLGGYCLFYFSLSSSHISLSIIQKRHIICCYRPLMSLKQNNEDLQNAKRHNGVSLIAAESYQSLKQMAYQSHGFVLSMPTKLHRGDLSTITRTYDYGVCLAHFTNNFFDH